MADWLFWVLVVVISVPMWLVWQHAPKYLRKLLRIAETGPTVEQMNALMKPLMQAAELVRAGEVGQALVLLDEIERRPSLPGAPALAIHVRDVRARALFALQDFDGALTNSMIVRDFYRTNYENRPSARNAAALGEALLQLGTIHYRRGEKATAVDCLDEARVINGVGAYGQSKILVELRLSTIYQEDGEMDQAYRHALAALTLAETEKSQGHIAESLILLASIDADRNNVVRARTLLNRAERESITDPNSLLHLKVLIDQAEIERKSGNVFEELSINHKILRAAGDVKVGRGLRQHQADLSRDLAPYEARALELGVLMAQSGSGEAKAMYIEALGILRDSEIAQLLRSGLVELDSTEKAGPAAQLVRVLARLATIELPVTTSNPAAHLGRLLSQVATIENPESPPGPTTTRGTDIYDQLEVVASARFRRLVQPPSRRVRKRPESAHHVVQLRLIESDGITTLFGSWHPPSAEPEVYSVDLPPEAAESLLAVTGRANQATSSRKIAESRAVPVRASIDGWPGSEQLRSLRANEDDTWRSQLPLFLPPRLVDQLADVAPDADDTEIPLVLFATDSILWNVPWAALALDNHAGTTLGDAAAVALIPTTSLLAEHPAPERVSQPCSVLTYLRGVNEEGLAIERAHLQDAWPGGLHEAATADELLRSLNAGHAHPVLTMSVHGDNRAGLAHSLILQKTPRTRLSAARMMSLRFPPTVVVGACFSGALDQRIGTDPTGIPSVMLSRGASTVIGGVFPLPDGPASGHATATILGHLYLNLANDIAAPWALRRAQQKWRTNNTTDPSQWSGIVAISSGAT